jgi:hypothetical protein
MRRVALLFIVLIFVASCSGSDSGKKSDSAAACETSPVNPNGDVELAVLMRQMAAWTDSTRSAILNNKPVPARPANFDRILTAEKTDKNIGPEPYGGLARHYLLQVENFDAAPKDQQKELFNSMVRACVGCHENFCGGPIKRINKLFLGD